MVGIISSRPSVYDKGLSSQLSAEFIKPLSDV